MVVNFEPKQTLTCQNMSETKRVRQRNLDDSGQPMQAFKVKSVINVTVHSGISSNGDYNNKTTEDNVWRNGGNTTPHSA